MSPNIRALADELDALRTELVELEAVEDPTEDQAARSAAILTEWDDKKDQHDAAAARAAKLDAIRSAQLSGRIEAGTPFGAPEVMKRSNPFENLDALRYENPASEDLMSRAVTALTDYRLRGVSDGSVERAVEIVESVPGAAAHAIVHGSPEYASAFRTWSQAQAQGQAPMYDGSEVAAVRAALAIGTGSTGGFTLPTLLDPTLIQTFDVQSNGIRAISRVETIAQNTWNGVTTGAVTAYWTAEAAAVTAGEPTLASAGVTAHKMSAYARVSYEMFEDGSLFSQIPGLIGLAFNQLEEVAFVSGSGSGAPYGIVTAISATAGSTVTATTVGSFTAASVADVFALLDAVPTRYEDRVTWLGNKKTFNTIRQMSTGSYGSLFWSAAPGSPEPLLGSPLVKASSMLAGTFTTTVRMILGDFSQYLIVDRIGTTVEVDPIVVDGSGLPTGQRALVAHKRVGANVLDVKAFRFLKG